MLVVAFAGCTPAGDDEANDADAGDASDAGDADDEEVAEAPDVEDLEKVTLKLYFMGEKKELSDKVWDTVASTFAADLNADFEVNYLGGGDDYKQKIMGNAASGDDYDLNFDGNWLVYAQMINNEAYLDITDLLPVYAPDLYANYVAADSLGAVTVNGRVMALPWTMAMSQRPYFRWNKNFSDDAGITYDHVDGNVTSLSTVEDMDAVNKELHAAYPERYTSMALNIRPFIVKHELVELGFHNLVYDINDSTVTILAVEQTAAYMEKAVLAKEWFDAGIIPPDAFANHGSWDGNELLSEEMLLGGMTWHEYRENLGKIKEGQQTYFFEMYPENKYSNRTPLSNIMAINANAANPERALMFMNLMETNGDMFDLVLYGIEGETYVLDDGMAVYPDGMDRDTSNYMDWIGRWAMWKPQFLRPDSTYGKGFWALEAELAGLEKNVNTPLLSFFPATDPINSELTLRAAIWEKDREIEYGVVDDAAAAVNEMIEEQKEAGIAAILAEVQMQVDAFLGN